jgi:glutaredoxin-like YruB-family protein
MLLILLLWTAAAWAGSIYKWVDKDGVVHYSDGAPEEGVGNEIETRPAVASDPTTTAPSANPETPPATIQPPHVDTRREAPKVEIYTTSWCHYCQQTKRYFRSRGIVFKEYDIENDRAAARRHRRYNPRGGVPVTVINGQPIIGFAPDAFDRALQGA